MLLDPEALHDRYWLDTKGSDAFFEQAYIKEHSDVETIH